MLQSHRRRGVGGSQCALAAAAVVGGGNVAVAEREAARGVKRGRVGMTVVPGALLGRGQRRGRRVVQLRLEGGDGPRRVGLADAAAVLPLLLVVVVIALVPLVGVALCPVHRLDVLPERGGVGVALRAARHLARVRLLRTANKMERVNRVNRVNRVASLALQFARRPSEGGGGRD